MTDTPTIPAPAVHCRLCYLNAADEGGLCELHLRTDADRARARAEYHEAHAHRAAAARDWSRVAYHNREARAWARITERLAT